MEPYKFDKIDFKKLAICTQRKPKDDKEEKFMREELTFEFYNLEQPGLSLKFSYGSTKYPVRFTFLHGGRYRLPRHVAQHVEEKGPPMYEWRPDGSGKLVKHLIGSKPRFQMRQVM